ncbi:MAG TPA: serine hydrolase [Pseudonocardiaceae bacterium]|nr:serine hydrolase [Pseudonocardiaceae bacterium]
MTPVVATVLVVVAMVAVVVHNLHGSDSDAGPTPGTTTISGAADALTTTQPKPTTTSLTPTTTPDNPALALAAVHAVDALHVSGVQYGVAILDRQTGHETVGEEGDIGFFSASVIKLFVVVALLHQQEQGQIKLDSNDQYDIRRALELSDDNAMDALWVNFNGPVLVDDMIKLADLRHTVLDANNSGEWGETKISATDVLAVWQYALTKLTPADSSLVIGYTHSAANNGADGFDQAFGLLQPPRNTSVKAKQGWMIAGSQMILNTTGVLGSDNKYVIAIMTKQSAGIGYSRGRANVDKASSLVQKALAPAIT